MFKQLMRLMMRSLLRRWLQMNHHNRYAKAGFVLPTVAMVLLVVVLLSLAITFRAFDRANYAQNTRVDQQVLSLATPALERAKVKLEKAFGEFTETPSELGLLGELTKPDKYKFTGENTLTLAFDQETLNTAWKFPVDLNNDGKADDGFNIYGIFFRSPERNDEGKFKEVRTPLEARSYPLPKLTSAAITNKDCPQSLGTSASLVGSSDWYKVGANLKKSFFIYAATIPNQGSGFSALEIQQDRERVPLVNNAVVYEDDLQITPGASGIQINGRIFTNANLLTGKRSSGGAVEYYQVSSPKSCFYEMENSKIVVGGNVGIGAPDSNTALEAVQVHLFKSGSAPTNKPSMSSAEQPVTQGAKDISYSDKRYVDRIASLRKAQMAQLATNDPQEVKDDVADGIDREKALENYFRARTRRVPTVDPQTDTPLPQGSGNALRPPDKHAFPYEAPDNTTSNNGTTLNGTVPHLMPPATEPSLVKNNQEETRLGDRIAMGNGLPVKWFNNNDFTSSDTQLIKDYKWDEGTPAPRYRTTQMQDLADFGSTQRNGFWEQAAAKAPSDTEKGVGGLRIVTGAGIYGRANSTSFLPEPPTAPNNPNTSEDESQFDVVWPDTMPMWKDDNLDGIPDIGASGQLDKQGDLKMRATVVYHYIQDPWNPDGVAADKRQSPLACISSYYDPTTEKTAMNRAGLPNIKLRETDRTLAWGTTNTVTANPGNSHNGVVYSMPSTAIDQATPGANGLFTISDPKAKDPTDSTADFKEKIIYQANLVFPDGRFVNEPLRKALQKDPDDRSLDEQSAIDTTLCAMTILNNLAGNPNDKPGVGDTVIPHGAIYETAFLDSRQIKSIENNDTGTPNTYDRPIEDRQPLEIRATVIDLDLLRRGTVGSTSEYLLPNSGIIYATREDALLDQSDNTTSWDLKSPVDYILDETRRPNGIMLINGQILARGGNDNNYNDIEKGLILATDLPAYVKADSSNGFNLHQSTPGGAELEEFDTTALTGTPKKWTETSFYGRTKLNKSFACRKGDTRLECVGTGDLWRPATVISDAITLLSNNFKTGYRNLGDYDLRNNTVLSADYITHKGLNPIIAGGGYDLNNDGDLSDSFSEVTLKLDLNGNGNQTDTSVSETNVTVAAARQFNGFYDNNYVTTTDWYKTDGKPEATKVNSYMNNFITPVQLRGSAAEYVMEICRKPLVSICKPGDWKIGIDSNGNSKLDSGEEKFSYEIPVDTAVGKLLSGTTARPALDPNDRIYPRRIAFARYPVSHAKKYELILDNSSPSPLPIALGIYSSKVNYAGNSSTAFTFPTISGFEGSGKSVSTNVPPNATNALRFQLNSSRPKLDWNPGSSLLLAQPIWKPLVQLNQIALVSNTDGWQQPATASKFNLIIASGDAPTRDSETNGGLPNFARFIENWTGQEAQISGSFIQFKRSTYATGPFMPILDRTKATLTKFGNPPSGDPRPYTAANNEGRTAQYMPPSRVYGFDVALLSQSPDLFATKFTLPSTQPPDQYFREVGKDDPWIQTLLCAAQDTNSNYGTAPTDYGTGKFYALPENLRPKNCPLGKDDI
uniref:Uncharacterized protein n=2 Tax=Planktothrix pseudagardhii TaxID=132604 RepID=A0A9W4GAC4_9CYAN|nr:hypothetical protein NO713_04297 [Planktothrix pseudagardhii]